LKWPNDVTLNGKKVAGMIIDASIESTRIENLILGVGINYKVNIKEIEKKIRGGENFYGAATLVSKNSSAKPSKLVQAFLEELEKILLLFDEGKSQTIITQWSKRSLTIGRNVSVSAPEGRISGKAIKLDKDGGLIIKQNSKSVRITAGDVTHQK
jgi:BirA family biotin operon repressor/biotin-[acetyl-CoA-carboxylase] ligase